MPCTGFVVYSMENSPKGKSRNVFPLKVSTQLYSAREKQQLTDLVDTMISYGLTYKQKKGADGQYTYILDP